MNALVSVVITTHNREALLRRAIGSVSAQTFDEWECVIVDDASSDATPALLVDLCAGDARVRVTHMPYRSGHTASLLAACALARGEFLAILDDDDWWEPRKLEQQVAAMLAAPHVVWSYHAAQLVSAAGLGTAELVNHGPGFSQRLLQYNWLRHSSMMFRRTAFDAVGGYDPQLRQAEDWDLIIRLTLRFGQDAIIGLPDLLVNYWCHPYNISLNAAERTASERRVVWKTVMRYGLLVRRPALALRMIDRQVDREMHGQLANGHYVRAFVGSAVSAIARPWRGWRWHRAAQFLQTALARQRSNVAGTSDLTALQP